MNDAVADVEARVVASTSSTYGKVLPSTFGTGALSSRKTAGPTTAGYSAPFELAEPMGVEPHPSRRTTVFPVLSVNWMLTLHCASRVYVALFAWLLKDLN